VQQGAVSRLVVETSFIRVIMKNLLRSFLCITLVNLGLYLFFTEEVKVIALIITVAAILLYFLRPGTVTSKEVGALEDANAQGAKKGSAQ
jgi:multisubunit Na+/H+ antiporter MnhC subunit